MGHRTYLVKSSDGNAEVLFEANNNIPFFWFFLISGSTIKKAEPEMIKAFTMPEEEAEAYFEQKGATTVLRLSKNEFLTNALSGKAFIQKHIPAKLQLYNDFVNYLTVKFNDHDILELDLIQIANFSDIYLFLKEIKGEVAAIRNNDFSGVHYYADENIFSYFTGYDGFYSDEFKNYSPEYAAAREKEVRARKSKTIKTSYTQKPHRPNGKPYIVKALFMIIVGVVFLIGCCKGFMKEGLSLKVAACTLFSLLILFVGILYFKR
ncbi:hypothetical protein ACTHGU_00140 [Chitinophagaceae bacterium MMS25-I14]